MKQLKLTFIALCALATASSFGAITYVDALEGSNTYATGGSLTNTSWVGTAGDQWEMRTDVEGNEDTLFQASNPVELTTELSGLADGTYTIWAFYWDQTESDNNNWILSAGLTSGSLTSYSSPGEPAVTNCTTNAVVDADTLSFTTSVKTTGINTARNLFGINLGQAVVSGGSVVNVYIDNNINALSPPDDNRTWYDGVGYEKDTSAPIFDDIVYVDALEGSSGNTFATGGSLADTSWVGTAGGQWQMRTGVDGNDDTLFQNNANPDELTTELTGLANGTYTIWAFYWDNTESDAGNWTLSAGLTSGALTSYSSPGEPAVTNCTTTGVVDADTLSFSTAVKTTGTLNSDRNLFGVNLGQVVVSNGASINIYIDNEVNALSGSDNRTWYDGVGYAKMAAGYSAWSNSYALTEGPEGDDDQDGVPNLSEYGIGGDPTDALDTGLATQTFLENSGGTNWFTVVYPARADNDGVTLFLETSDSLTAPEWENAGYTVLGTNVTGGEFNTISNRISTADSQTLFARLRIELD
jgi:hypothetical protein